MYCKVKASVRADSVITQHQSGGDHAAQRRLVRRQQREGTRRAFSLVELLVVMVIIGLLASLVVFRTRSYLIASKQNAAKVEIAKIVQAIETFYAANDRYPNNDEGLQVLVEPSNTFPDGILNKVPQDPWKQPYQYNNPGESSAFEVICLGADGQEGGEGADRDITSDNLDDQQT